MFILFRTVYKRLQWNSIGWNVKRFGTRFPIISIYPFVFTSETKLPSDVHAFIRIFPSSLHRYDTFHREIRSPWKFLAFLLLCNSSANPRPGTLIITRDGSISIPLTVKLTPASRLKIKKLQGSRSEFIRARTGCFVAQKLLPYNSEPSN